MFAHAGVRVLTGHEQRPAEADVTAAETIRGSSPETLPQPLPAREGGGAPRDGRLPHALRSLHKLPLSRKLRYDLRVLATFIRIYCDGRHADRPRAPVPDPIWRLTATGKPPAIHCPACTKLLGHATAKRRRCPLDPKPACKHCPQHCYAPAYRAQIRKVMRYSGRRLILSGRVDYLWHLLF